MGAPKRLREGKLPGPRKKLTGKQQKWLDHYLVHRNGTQASLYAGCPVKSASSYGSVLLKNPLVQKALAEYDFEKSYPKEVDKGWIIQQLHRLYEENRKKNPGTATRNLEQLIKLSDFSPDNNPTGKLPAGNAPDNSTQFNEMPLGEKLDVLRRTIERLAHGDGKAKPSGSPE